MRGVLQLLRGVSEDGSGPARLAVRVDERIALDAVVPLPLDGEVGVGLFDVDGLPQQSEPHYSQISRGI